MNYRGWIQRGATCWLLWKTFGMAGHQHESVFLGVVKTLFKPMAFVDDGHAQVLVAAVKRKHDGDDVDGCHEDRSQEGQDEEAALAHTR